jgi:hypothetical protein
MAFVLVRITSVYGHPNTTSTNLSYRWQYSFYPPSGKKWAFDYSLILTAHQILHESRIECLLVIELGGQQIRELVLTVRKNASHHIDDSSSRSLRTSRVSYSSSTSVTLSSKVLTAYRSPSQVFYNTLTLLLAFLFLYECAYQQRRLKTTMI